MSSKDFNISPGSPNFQMASAFAAALGKEHFSRKDFAERHNLEPSRITMFTKGRLPSDEFLKILVQNWKLPENQIDIMKGRLKDEIKRAGLDISEFIISHVSETDDPELSKALAAIDNIVSKEKDLRDNIIHLAKILSASGDMLQAAEESRAYRA